MSSLGAVVPFLVVLSEPSKVNALPLIPSIVDYLKITNASELQIYLTIIFILFSPQEFTVVECDIMKILSK
jgi:hypothetical protein